MLNIDVLSAVMLPVVMLSAFMLNVVMLNAFKLMYLCCYAECHIVFVVKLTVILYLLLY